MGQLVAGDWKSYRYLVESIRKFPNQASHFACSIFLFSIFLFTSPITQAGRVQQTIENYKQTIETYIAQHRYFTTSLFLKLIQIVQI